MNAMRKKAMEMQKALQAEEIVVEEDGVRLVMSGDQKIKELTVNGEERADIKKVFEEALKKIQEIAARKLLSL